jgi:hypothetical protein
MRSCHTFRKSMTGWIAPAQSPVGCYSLRTALILAATARIAGAFIVELPVEIARLLRAGSWGNEKNLSICSTAAALLMRGSTSTAASTVRRAADR